MIENIAYESGDQSELDCRKERFIKIWGFMLTDLKLEKSELIIYAVIFAMYKNYCDGFTGSREYLMGWCNASKTTVDRALSSLEKKGLIHKDYRQYGQMKKAVYFINTEALPDCEMFRLENRNRDNNERIRKASVEITARQCRNT